jgi:hypothetical protein
MVDCPDLSMLQRAAGLVTWRSFLQVAGIALVVAGTLLFCSGLVRRFLQQVRLIEVLLWALCAGSAVATFLVPASWQLWPALAACLLFPGASALSVRLRKIPVTPAQASQLLALVWGGMAIATQQGAVGFIAVAAFMAVLGLSIFIAPFCYGFGFNSERALERAPVAGAVITLTFGAVAAAGWSLGPFDVFRSGALWLGSFTWFLGLLILSNGFVRRVNYLRSQAATVLSLAGTLTIGMLFAIDELTTMASTFGLFYLAAKIIEVSVHGRIAMGVKLLAAGGMVTSLWYASQKYLPVLL